LSGWRLCIYRIRLTDRGVELDLVPGVYPEQVPLRAVLTAAWALAADRDQLLFVRALGPGLAVADELMGHTAFAYIGEVVCSGQEVSDGSDDHDGQPGQRPR
jgi:hypothetical protein